METYRVSGFKNEKDLIIEGRSKEDIQEWFYTKTVTETNEKPEYRMFRRNGETEIESL